MKDLKEWCEKEKRKLDIWKENTIKQELAIIRSDKNGNNNVANNSREKLIDEIEKEYKIKFEDLKKSYQKNYIAIAESKLSADKKQAMFNEMQQWFNGKMKELDQWKDMKIKEGLKQIGSNGNGNGNKNVVDEREQKIIADVNKLYDMRLKELMTVYNNQVNMMKDADTPDYYKEERMKDLKEWCEKEKRKLDIWKENTIKQELTIIRSDKNGNDKNGVNNRGESLIEEITKMYKKKLENIDTTLKKHIKDIDESKLSAEKKQAMFNEMQQWFNKKIKELDQWKDMMIKEALKQMGSNGNGNNVNSIKNQQLSKIMKIYNTILKDLITTYNNQVKMIKDAYTPDHYKEAMIKDLTEWREKSKKDLEEWKNSVIKKYVN